MCSSLVPLYEKYGVDIALAGHVHSYERTWPILRMSIHQKKGVRYIVSGGGGGGGLEQAGPQRTWFTLHVMPGATIIVSLRYMTAPSNSRPTTSKDGCLIPLSWPEPAGFKEISRGCSHPRN
jgi:hypothetical protein